MNTLMKRAQNRVSSNEAMSGTVEMIIGLAIVVVVVTVVYTGLGRSTNDKAVEVNDKITNTDIDLKDDLEKTNTKGKTK